MGVSLYILVPKKPSRLEKVKLGNPAMSKSLVSKSLKVFCSAVEVVILICLLLID